MLFALLAVASAATKPRTPELGDSTQMCSMCKFYVSLIHDYLQEGQTVEEIKEKVKALCGYVTDPLKPLCNVLVDTFIPTIIEYIEKQMETNKICIAIKFCRD